MAESYEGRTVGAETIRRIKEEFNKNDIPCDLIESVCSLKILPRNPSTFQIEVSDDGHEVTIFACEWHEHFESADKAEACVYWLMSPYYRIVELWSGSKFMSSHAERYGPSGWSCVGAPMASMDLYRLSK